MSAIRLIAACQMESKPIQIRIKRTAAVPNTPVTGTTQTRVQNGIRLDSSNYRNVISTDYHFHLKSPDQHYPVQY